MTKKVLILVIGANIPPWDVMPATANETWNKDHVEGVDVITYFGRPVKQNTDTEIYFDVPEGYEFMGHKLLKALDWCLENREFDYITRVNSSTFVHKQNLYDYVQSLPDDNVFEGAIVTGENGEHNYLWGGLGWIFSKDVVRRVVENCSMWNHDLMEDVAMGDITRKLSIPFRSGNACSIDKDGVNWRCLQYGFGESFTFNAWDAIKQAEGHYFFRCKQDYDRSVDAFVMERLKEFL